LVLLFGVADVWPGLDVEFDELVPGALVPAALVPEPVDEAPPLLPVPALAPPPAPPAPPPPPPPPPWPNAGSEAKAMQPATSIAIFDEVMGFSCVP
jgi:hypothetical protein